MPHRANKELGPGPRHSLPSLIEDDEEDDQVSAGFGSFRVRPSYTSAPATSRSRHAPRPSRPSHNHSTPGPAATAKAARSRLAGVYSTFNQRYRRQGSDLDDTGSFYFAPGLEYDSDEEDLHARRPSIQNGDGLINGVHMDNLSAEEDVEPETAEDMQRLEWQTMLVSVLNGDVLRSEKTRIGRVLESYEAQRVNRLELWQELRARTRGRTVEQEKTLLEDRRRRTLPPLIEEIMHFRILDGEENLAPGGSNGHTLKANDSKPLQQVASLLRRWDAAESLYPNLKAMRQDYPDIITAIRKSINSIKHLTGSETLDVSAQQSDGLRDEVQRFRRPTAFPNDRQNPDSTTFVERILKDGGLQRTFERGALVDLHGHVHNARDLYMMFPETLHEMNLPNFTDDLVTIISFPTQLMESLLRVRLAIAQQVAEPSLLSVDQMLDDFRLAIGLACTLKNDYEELMRPDPEGKWELPPCIGEDYEETILAALRFFFKLIHQKLKSAHKGIYFKETELLEAQWYILEEVAMATRGGGLLVAEHVCSLTNKLILRVIASFQGQISLPAYTLYDSSDNQGAVSKYGGRKADARAAQKDQREATAEDTIRWFAKVLEGVRLRHRKLQRYSRLLMSRFGNSAEYSLEDVNTTELMNTLVATEHFLVYTEFYESQGVYIVGDPSLYHSPDKVRQMVNMAFQVNRRAGRTWFGPEGSDLISDHEDDGDSESAEDGQYLLLMTPQDNFVWSGVVLVLSMPTVELDLQEMRARLVAASPSKLESAKQRFCRYFLDPEEEGEGSFSESEELDPPLRVLVEQQAHLPPVNRELRKIARATQRLAEVIVDSVHEVRKTLNGVEGAQELMENWFLFSSEHGQASLKFMDRQAQTRMNRLLTRLAISWVAFICDSCDPTDRKTFRWAVNALEFAMVRTRGPYILQLQESDFKTLQQKVASCMTLLVSHFDILGARSSYEEKEKERERERLETVRSDDSMGGSIHIDNPDDLGPFEDESAIHAPPDRSLRGFSDRVARGVEATDLAREDVHVEQHIAGRVLLTDGAEDESLAFLASTASKTSIRWQQGRFIAAGAFGSVYLALNLETGGVMAAKEIRFKNSTSLSTLYQQVKDELAVMEVLHHPNIVEYYGLEVHRDKVYIFEEYCSGGTLASLLESGRIEDETVAQVYTMQMLEGLMYLHSMGVVHRDIKPDNILLDHNGIIKFVDFGAAKILAKNRGSVQVGRSVMVQNPTVPPTAGSIPGMQLPMNSLTGTPMYMSPEVIKSDRRSRKGAMDIWSMGCVILECVTGRKPWSNLDNEWAIMFHIGVATQHPPLPEPGQLSSMGIDFIRQCLTIDGMKRPSAAELYDHPWILEFREELAAYEQENGSDIPPTPSLNGSSLRTDTSELLRTDSLPPKFPSLTSVSPGTVEKAYDSGAISPPGIFSGGDPAMTGQ